MYKKKRKYDIINHVDVLNRGKNMQNRRWSDKDPILKEALEVLKISPAKTKDDAAEFILNLQDQVAGEVLDHVYEMMDKYQGKGNRWYDSDPVIMKAIELLRLAPKKTQREIALKILLAVEEDDFDALKSDTEKEEK